MSTTFSDPHQDTYYPYGVDHANEIRRAYSERRQAIGQSSAALWTAASATEAGDYCLVGATWRAMQEWCEQYCTSFINHLSPTINSPITGFRNWTVEDWRSAAGLHTDGAGTANGTSFRRLTEWDGSGEPDWEYGYIDDDDIDGFWIRADLQRALTALAWTTLTLSQGNVADLAYRQVFGASSGADCNTAWASAAWTSGQPGWTRGDVAPYFAGATAEASSSYSQARVRGRFTAAPWDGRPCAVNVYLRQEMADAQWAVPPPDWHTEYASDYAGASGAYVLFETLAEATGSRQTSLIGNIDTPPQTTPGGPTPTSGQWKIKGAMSYNGSPAGAFLCKWNFTHSGVTF